MQILERLAVSTRVTVLTYGLEGFFSRTAKGIASASIMTATMITAMTRGSKRFDFGDERLPDGILRSEELANWN